MKTHKKYSLLLLLAMCLHWQNSYAQTSGWVPMNRPYIINRLLNDFQVDNNTVYAATDSGLYATSDDGARWVRNLTLHGKPLVKQVLICDTIVLATSDVSFPTDARALNTSLDHGLTWDSSLVGPGRVIGSREGLFYYDNIFDGGLSYRSFDGTHNISFDTQGSIETVSYPIGINDNFIVCRVLTLMNHQPLRASLSTDNCRSWKEVVDVGGNLCFDGNLFIACNSDGIYRSADSGQTWQLVNFQVRGANLLVANGTVYAYSDSIGVMYTLDHGDSWRSYNNGLPNQMINRLIAGKDELYVELKSQELYRTSFASAVKSEIHYSASLSLYPNPVYSEGTVSYNLPTNQTITLKIYDALGRIVAAPISDEMQSSGEHTLPLDLNKLVPGYYNCQLQTAQGNSTVKFLVVL